MKLIYGSKVNENTIVAQIEDEQGIIIAEGLMKVNFKKFQVKEGEEFEVSYKKYAIVTTKWVDDDGHERTTERFAFQ